MERKKNTNVIALTDYTPAGHSAVRHAASLARFFESTLTIIPNFSFKGEIPNRAATPEFTALLEQVAGQVTVHVDDTPYQPQSLHAMAESANNIMYVIGVTGSRKESYFNPKQALRFIAPSRLPVMTVGLNGPRDDQWQHVLLSVEVDLPTKEKALWAGYFNRYGHSTIHILHNEYQDKISKGKLEDHLEFIEKLYTNLEIEPVTHVIRPKAYDLDQYAVEHAGEYEASALVVMTTTHKTFIDRLFGVREQHLPANAAGLPVLFLNERDDLFVLCT